jgi:hypothetical protein
MLAALVVVLALSACGASDSQPPRTYRMPPDETHLLVRWPATKSGIPAIAFRIPRETIVTDRIRLLEDGRTIDSVWIRLQIDDYPELKAAYEARNRAHASNPRTGTLEQRWLPRKRFLIELGSVNSADGRERRRLTTGGNELETPYLGMARFSKLICPDPSSTYVQSKDWRDIYAQKGADDPSPEGCAYWRGSTYITNSWPEDRGEEGIDLKCSGATCYVNLQVHGRGLMISVLHGDLPLIHELAKAARANVRSYMVEQENTK